MLLLRNGTWKCGVAFWVTARCGITVPSQKLFLMAVHGTTMNPARVEHLKKRRYSELGEKVLNHEKSMRNMDDYCTSILNIKVLGDA